MLDLALFAVILMENWLFLIALSSLPIPLQHWAYERACFVPKSAPAKCPV
jgi:hypothetical protein